MPAANDHLANAVALSGASGSVTMDFTGADYTETGSPDEATWWGGPHKSLWFRWTAPSAGAARFTLSAGAPAEWDIAITPDAVDWDGWTAHDSSGDSTWAWQTRPVAEVPVAPGDVLLFFVDDYSYETGAPPTTAAVLSWSIYVPPPPPPPPPLTINLVEAYASFPISALDDEVLVPGYPVRVYLDTGAPSDAARVIMPGGWSTTTFYGLDTHQFFFDMPPVSEGVGSGALVLVDVVGRTCSIDVTVLTPETSYRTPAPVTYDHVSSGFGTNQASARSGSTPAAAETGTINPDGGWGVAFGYSYDGTNYKLEQLGWRLDLSGYGKIEIRAIPPAPDPPPGLTYGQILVQQEREQYPFGPTSDFSMGALIGDPVIDIGWQEFGFPDHRWSQYGVGIYVPTAADAPLAGGIPDPTVVQPESFFTSARLAAHADGYNTAVGWGDDMETLTNWDLIAGAWHVGAGFVGNCMYLDGVGSARQKAATRPGAFAGGAYRMDGWIGGSVAGNSLRVGMEFYDQAGSLISTVWGSPYVVAPGDENLFNDTTWVSGTAPAGSWTRGLILEFTSGTGQAFFDQVVFRTDSIAYPGLATSFSLPSADLIVDGSGLGYALMYAVTDAQVALETATHPTENLRFGLTGATFTAAYQPVGWRYWLPAPFAPTPVVTTGWQVGSVAMT